MLIDIINVIIKSIGINIFSMLIFFKLSSNDWKNINKIKKWEIVFVIIITSVLYISLKQYLGIIVVVFITYFVQAMVLKRIINQNISSILIEMIVSISISYILFIFAVALEFFIQRGFKIDYKIINIILTILIESIFVFCILKIKRLKNALSFLEKNKNEYIEVALISISLFVIIMYGLVSIIYESFTINIFIYFILLSICMIITIQKILVMYYKQKLIDDTINQYQKELKEKDEKIEKLTKENYRASKINHEFYNRQKSLEYMVKNSLTNYNTELGEDVDILSKIKNLTEEHSNKVSEDKILLKLETTGIDEVDEMFTYMQQECIKNNIEFKLKINGNIYPLINNYITKSQLVTLIGDHLRDAIIAINFSNKSNKKIFVILGIKENCYELCIYDSGIEFEIQTLLKLGMEPITTHKNSGGTGIGFMTTFETLKECKASLIIEEYGDNIEYTKLVKFKFDKKSEYKICSYRSDEIKKLDYSNRIKIENKLTNI